MDKKCFEWIRINQFFIGMNGLILVRIMDSHESFGSLDHNVKEIHMRKFYRECVEKDGNGLVWREWMRMVFGRIHWLQDHELIGSGKEYGG